MCENVMWDQLPVCQLNMQFSLQECWSKFSALGKKLRAIPAHVPHG
jgi:hypothetical protein